MLWSAGTAFADKLSVDRSSVPFGQHDLGTTTPPASLTVRNNSDSAVDLHVRLSGTEEFTWKSDCPQELKPKAMCGITVSFSPTAVSSDEKPTTSTLYISAGDAETNK